MQAFAGIDGQSALTTGGYNDQSPVQDFGGVNNELFNLGNPLLDGNVDELLIDNTEIKIDATPRFSLPLIRFTRSNSTRSIRTCSDIRGSRFNFL